MKRAIWYLSLFIYLVFSQFVFKAVATTELVPSENETFCMTKKLDTIDGKQDCREKSNSAVFSSIFEYDLFLLDTWVEMVYNDFCLIFECPYSLDITYDAQAPPDERWVLFSKYVHNYVGITLILF